MHKKEVIRNQQTLELVARQKKDRKVLWKIIKKAISLAVWILRILQFFSDEG